MDNSLKQRIVGAIVLIALAVIFLPPLLKDTSPKGEFHSKIPPQPAQVAVLTDSDRGQEQVKTDDAMDVNSVSQEQPSVIEKTKDAAKETEKSKKTEGQAVINNSGSTKTSASERKHKLVDKKTPKKKTPKKKTPTGTEKASLSSPKAEIKTTISDKFKSAAWVIQVASFSSRDNARKLVSKLKQGGFKAYRRDHKAEGGQSLSRVYVGPYIDKPRASKDLPKINKLASVKGLVRVYDPVKD